MYLGPPEYHRCTMLNQNKYKLRLAHSRNVIIAEKQDMV